MTDTPTEPDADDTGEWPAPQPDPDAEPSHGDTTETGDDGPAAS